MKIGQQLHREFSNCTQGHESKGYLCRQGTGTWWLAPRSPWPCLWTSVGNVTKKTTNSNQLDSTNVYHKTRNLNNLHKSSRVLSTTFSPKVSSFAEELCNWAFPVGVVEVVKYVLHITSVAKRSQHRCAHRTNKATLGALRKSVFRSSTSFNSWSMPSTARWNLVPDDDWWNLRIPHCFRSRILPSYSSTKTQANKACLVGNLYLLGR